MKIFFRKIICICTIVTLLSISFTVSAAGTTSETEMTAEYAQTIVNTAIAIAKNNYRFDITSEELYKNALNQIIKEHPEVWESAFRGIFDNLDMHSNYFNKEEFRKFFENISGEFCGIGVAIMEFEEGLMVSRIYDNSPAQKAGLLPGDIIVSADGKSVAGIPFEEAKSYIVGEKGSSVTIGYTRDGQYAEKTMKRDNVVIDSGSYKTMENHTVGYIQLYSFDEHADDFITKALKDFDAKNIKNIIMDLRNNPGGSLVALQQICQHFIPEGPVIHIEYKNPLRDTHLDSTNKNPKYNLIVLVNENSASASEAFAGAVQDTGVGIVVGQQSFGKGTMQNVTKFKVGGGIKLTEAVYLTPNRRNINGKGIEPDVKVKDKKIKYTDAKDLLPITYDRTVKIGDKGDDVKALKQRLELLGLSVDADTDVFDLETEIAVKKFQESQKLYVYGVLDITTQLALENLFMAATVSDNNVLNTALEIFRTGTLESYKTEWLPETSDNLTETKASAIKK